MYSWSMKLIIKIICQTRKAHRLQPTTCFQQQTPLQKKFGSTAVQWTRAHTASQQHQTGLVASFIIGASGHRWESFPNPNSIGESAHYGYSLGLRVRQTAASTKPETVPQHVSLPTQLLHKMAQEHSPRVVCSALAPLVSCSARRLAALGCSGRQRFGFVLVGTEIGRSEPALRLWTGASRC